MGRRVDTARQAAHHRDAARGQVGSQTCRDLPRIGRGGSGADDRDRRRLDRRRPAAAPQQRRRIRNRRQQRRIARRAENQRHDPVLSGPPQQPHGLPRRLSKLVLQHRSRRVHPRKQLVGARQHPLVALPPACAARLQNTPAARHAEELRQNDGVEKIHVPVVGKAGRDGRRGQHGDRVWRPPCPRRPARPRACWPLSHRASSACVRGVCWL